MSFAPQHATKYPIVAGGVNRGVAYWADKSGRQTRILFGTADGRLISLDARTGKLDPAFGKGGVVDLHEGLGEGEERDLSKLYYGVTSAPAEASALAVSTPSPDVAPVTIARFLLRSIPLTTSIAVEFGPKADVMR